MRSMSSEQIHESVRVVAMASASFSSSHNESSINGDLHGETSLNVNEVSQGR